MILLCDNVIFVNLLKLNKLQFLIISISKYLMIKLSTSNYSTLAGFPYIRRHLDNIKYLET